MACYKTVSVDGYVLPAVFPVDGFRKALTYQPEDDDAFIVTFPKCGTTWLMYILYLIRNDCPTDDFKMWDHIPWLELHGIEAVEKAPKPNLIKSHLPFDRLPWNESAKYIFLTRNPFDCCVSFYYHSIGFPVYDFKDGKFDDFFNMFVNGANDFGDYFDYLNSIFKEKHRKNVLFLTYEQLKESPEDMIIKVAKFLGPEFEDKVADQEFLRRVIEMSSVSGMRNQETSFHHGRVEGRPLIRKGVIGDYTRVMSEEQAKMLNDRFKEKCSGSDVLKLWEKYGIPLSDE